MPLQLKIGASLLLPALFIALLWGGNGNEMDAKPSSENPPTPSQTVLVELFTSQGCSSCPPADRVLQRLVEDAEAGQLEVIALSYHVDYWNRLGWKDPYSQAAFSERQRQYAQVLPDRRVYTPQMVIQGQQAHVGSREKEVRASILHLSQQPQTTTISTTLKTVTTKNSQREISYEISGRTAGIILQTALVETTLGNDVPRGENSGHHLAHANVVRTLSSTIDPPLQGILTIDTNILKNPNNGKIVLFVQDTEQMTVLGATELSLKQ